MDSWSRFQHLIVSEMWGHMGKCRAGNEETGPSAGAVTQEKPRDKARARRGAKNKVVKLQDPVTRKAAIVYYKPVPQTDTGR